MKNITITRFLLVLIASFSFVFSACDEGPMEDAGESLDEAGDEVEDAVD